MKQDDLAKIKTLEVVSRKLEPNADTLQQWNAQMSTFGSDFIRTLPHRPTFYHEDLTSTAVYQFPFDQAPYPMEKLLPVLDKALTQTALNAASSKHFGYVPGGGLFSTAIGDYIAAVTNVYSGIFYAGPGAVRIENELIKWMCQLMGYPSTALGNLTSGGSIANLIAITTARDRLPLNPKDFGQAVIYLTSQTHHCVQKSLRIAGLKNAIIRYVPMDHSFAMDTEALAQHVIQDKNRGLIPFMIVGSAGTTDIGAIDPLKEMGHIAQKHGIWFHIDAAYGGFFCMVEELRPKLAGIELSDSVAIDPHKGFFLSYGLGAILIKDVAAQYDAHYYQANYMQDSIMDINEYSPADLSPELTRHFRGLRMWISLQLLGLEPFKAALLEKHLLCQYFYEKVQAIRF